MNKQPLSEMDKVIILLIVDSTLDNTYYTHSCTNSVTFRHQVMVLVEGCNEKCRYMGH